MAEYCPRWVEAYGEANLQTMTEHRRSSKNDAPHGPNFWRIYSALMAKAIEKGLYNDKYIDKIIEQEDGE